MDAIEIVRGLLIPITAVATTVSLAWLKFYADARKRLDDLLFDLEHKLRDPATDRTRLWMNFLSRDPKSGCGI